ncbi:MAG: hypothetical protein R3C30_16645 [Hyphomonadaceae bacterium]
MTYGPMVAGVDHLPHTLDIACNAFSRGEPPHGAELPTCSNASSSSTTPAPSPPLSSNPSPAPPA